MFPVLLRRLAPFALLAVCAAGAYAADPVPAATGAATPMSTAEIDRLVKQFNPDLLGGNPMESTFTAPGSDIAGDVNGYNWFTTVVFLPFLVLPQILLLLTMIKFHDRGDGRKPATFMHHTKLENAWTAIPILTLFIVGIPAYPLLYKMELPAKDDNHTNTVITVRGKQFAWDYDYKREGVSVGPDIVGLQEPVVLLKDNSVSLAITSNDVNHAWWVPAFGVKKDAINGRYNHCWFTPKRVGLFKGQCAELCGKDHGVMVISAVVTERRDFDTWVSLQKNRNDTTKVFKALQPDAGEFQEAAFAQALKDFLAKGRSPERVQALRYWIASDYESMRHRPPERRDESDADFKALYDRWVALKDIVSKQRRDLAERAIAAAVAEAEAPVHPVVAEQESKP